ncbi:MAG TPA: hypothetical protein PLL77_14445 [Pyrinomonadaceae bacterium]|nr:hypothetical protein [Pyrinomonadaceae bacterium]
MDTFETKNINVEIQCDLTPGTGGERWDIKEVFSQDTGLELGDLGIYDFDAYSDFPKTFMDAILALLVDETDFFEEDIFYNMKVEIKSGGGQLGIATRTGFGRQFLESIQERGDCISRLQR